MAQIGILFTVPEKVEQLENYCLFQDIAVTIRKDESNSEMK
jgi:hypothetical protein